MKISNPAFVKAMNIITQGYYHLGQKSQQVIFLFKVTENVLFCEKLLP